MFMKQTFENCFQCVSYKNCFTETNKIKLADARETAELCSKPYKGLGTDLVKIINDPKCISLKKALRLFNEGRIEWIDFHTVRFLE